MLLEETLRVGHKGQHLLDRIYIERAVEVRK